jgi:hypothetical protein
MKKYTIPSAKRYATKIGADYVSINKPVDEISHIKNIYAQSIAMKLFLFREFLKTDYDRLLFLDCDILIKDESPDIFEYDQHKHHDFLARREGPWTNWKSTAREMLGSEAIQFYNSGVFISGRTTAEKLNAFDFGDFLLGSPIQTCNQCMFGHVIWSTGVLPYPLHRIWNCNWQDEDVYGDFIHFIHYAGNGKKKLVEDWKHSNGYEEGACTSSKEHI